MTDKSLEKEIRKLASDWINRESNKTSLITITSCELSKDTKYVHLGISVLPENQTTAALHFLTRNKDVVRDYLKKHGKLHRIPYVVFIRDEGEENRQRIFELLAE